MIENESEKSVDVMEAEDSNKTMLARGVELVLLVPSVWRRRWVMRARNSGSMGFIFCPLWFRVPLICDLGAITVVARTPRDYRMDRKERDEFV